ncbi:MAG TPA: AraC family transcriptional regulator, partial [Xanthomonadaceae bacterium]|nr:AraC family transcriptional regulator [Xanthomonadaceae bacterium]
MQVVVPVRGVLEIEVGGRGGRVEQARVACIAPGTGHDQGADGDNRFLLLNCPVELLGEGRMEQLRQRPFLPTGPRLQRLAAYLDRRCPDREPVPEPLLQHCLPGL